MNSDDKKNSKSPPYPEKRFPAIGACGLDCGLCPRYYTDGPSRCPGCAGPDFSNKHPTCSYITCCVKRKHHEVCAECPDFPCSKFKSPEEYRLMKESSSYPSCKKIIPNLICIKEHGIDAFIDLQKKRIELLREMIDNFNDGRSKSFYCRVSSFFDVVLLRNSIDKAHRQIEAETIDTSDIKKRAKILKNILNEIALKEGMEI